MKYKGILFLFLLLSYQAFTQKASNDINTIYLHFTGAYQFPQGDLAKRFGATPNVGVHVEWMQAKTNFIFGVNSSFSFGQFVREDVGALFRSNQGVLFGTDQTATALYLNERVYTFGAHAGKLFALNYSKNPRSGIRLTLGIGHMRHHIGISDQFESANQFKGEYRKGYDRLTAGLALTPFIGYQYTSLNRYLNLIAGFEYVAGFTKSQRSWDYDLFSQDTKKRFDGLLGFRLGFSLPLFIGDSDSEVEY